MDRTYVTVNIRIYYHTLTFGLYTHRQIPTVIILKTIGGKSEDKFMRFFFGGGKTFLNGPNCGRIIEKFLVWLTLAVLVAR